MFQATRDILVFLLLLSVAAVPPAHAQISIGTDPNAPHVPLEIGQDIHVVRQTAVIPGSAALFAYMTLGVWIDPSHVQTRWARLIFDIRTGNDEDDFYDTFDITIRGVGWYRFTYATSRFTSPFLEFALVGDHSHEMYDLCIDPFAEPECPTQPVGAYHTRRTTVDAYPDGELVDEGGDMVFRALFHNGDVTAVPEPLTMLLVGTGLATVGIASRRRRFRK